MLKTLVIAHFGSQIEIARALNIGKSSVSDWPEIVPEGQAYKLQVLTGGALIVNPAFYPKVTAAMRREAGRRNRRLAKKIAARR